MAKPTAYREEYVEQARKLCLLLGATDVDLANFFGTTDRTVRTWKTKHPEFAAAVEAGKAKADIEIAQSLYNRALGGSEVACIFWLKNRQPAKWREKTTTEHTGENGGPIAVKNTIDLSECTDDQLRVLASLRIA